MKQGLNAQAYTIVEVLIVLAVTGALLAVVILFVTGQQGKTEFTQAINDIQAQINDVINNVSTGYYANTGNVKCDNTGPGGTPNLSAVSGTIEGSNQDCVFIGRAIQFYADNVPSDYTIYDIAGLRNAASGPNTGQPAQNLTEAAPTLIVSPPQGVDTRQKQKLAYGLSAAKMWYTNNGTSYPANAINTVAFMSSLANYNQTTRNLASGAQKVELHPLMLNIDLTISASDKSSDNVISNFNSTTLAQPAHLYQDFSVSICFNSGGSNQNGTVTIGNNYNQLSTAVQISGGTC